MHEETGAQQGRLDLLALEHGRTSVTFDGPDLRVNALDGSGAQYAVDENGHAQLLRHRAQPLFNAPQTIRGQTAMQTDERPDT
jgi:hypothetical protein